MKKLRLLYVVPNVPSLIRVRPYNLIKRLARRHRVYLVCLVTERYEEKFIGPLKEHGVAVEAVRLARARSLWNCLRALPSMTPLRVAYFFAPEAKRRVEELVRQGEVDLLHIEHIKSAPLAEGVVGGPIPVVYDAVDCISLYLERQLKTVNSPWQKAFIFSELWKMRRYEGKSLGRFDWSVVSSEVDLACLQRLAAGRGNMSALPNGVDLEYFRPTGQARESDVIVCCAKLDYFPNAQAVLYFAQEILPLIRRKKPGVKFYIVGSNPPQRVRALARERDIFVTGYVSDIRPFLAQAGVAVAPLLTKAGTQYKVVEAMACGTPVVATPLACEGLGMVPGEHLLVGRDPADFAEKVLAVLEDGALAERLARTGREYIVANHDWEAIVAQLEGIYQGVLEGRRAASQGAGYVS